MHSKYVSRFMITIFQLQQQNLSIPPWNMVDSPWSSGYMYPIRSFCSPDVESRSPTKRPIKTLKREVPGKVCDPFNTQSFNFFLSSLKIICLGPTGPLGKTLITKPWISLLYLFVIKPDSHKPRCTYLSREPHKAVTYLDHQIRLEY